MNTPNCPVCSFGVAIRPVPMECVARKVWSAHYKCMRCSVELERPERLPEGTSPGLAGVSEAFLAEACASGAERVTPLEIAAVSE